MGDLIRVGITGTRQGFTSAQRTWFVDQAATVRMREWHYGDCVGVDVEAFGLLLELGAGGVFHAWPGAVRDEFKAGTIRDAGMLGIVVHDVLPPLERNQQIVNHVDELWAFPAEMTEQLRSGTWATIRRARKHPTCALTVVLPDGSTPPATAPIQPSLI